MRGEDFKKKKTLKKKKKRIETPYFLFPASLSYPRYHVLQITPEPVRNSKQNGLNNVEAAKHL